MFLVKFMLTFKKRWCFGNLENGNHFKLSLRGPAPIGVGWAVAISGLLLNLNFQLRFPRRKASLSALLLGMTKKHDPAKQQLFSLLGFGSC